MHIISSGQNIYRHPFATVTDIAGVVVDVGPDVQHVTAGDEVVAMLHPFVSISQF
jgi:NADPH:quinone reductase-like Zn-dependent oxidoreductase